MVTLVSEHQLSADPGPGLMSNYNSDLHYLFIDERTRSLHKIIHTDPLVKNVLVNKNSVDLTNDKTNFFIFAQSGIYHTIVNTMSAILYLNDEYENANFIIQTNDIYRVPDQRKKMVDFLELFLNDNNISYNLIDDLKDVAIVKNFYMLDHHMIRIKTDSDYLVKVKIWGRLKLNNSDVDKVYISRKNLTQTRLKNESVLEDYLKSLGFFIFYPEDCDTLIDQLSIVSNASTIVSLTSSGLANAFFAKEGATLIELVTSLDIYNNGKEKKFLHQIYSAMSFVVGLNYVGVPNKNKDALDVINYFELNSKIKSLLL